MRRRALHLRTVRPSLDRSTARYRRIRLRVPTSLFPRFRNRLFRPQDLRRTAQRILIDIPSRIVSLPLLLFRQRADAVLQVFERGQIPPLEMLRILQRNDIPPPKLLIAHQILPHLRLDIQPLHRIPRKHVPRIPQRDDMRVVSEDLERHGIDHLALIVLREIKLNQFGALHRKARDGIGAVFLEPGEDVGEVEDGAVARADGVGEGLEGNGAEVEGESLEGCAGDFGLGYAGAGAGRVGIFGGPLRMGDLQPFERVSYAGVQTEREGEC